MSSVPVSMETLEEITLQVARELLEEWAINDRFNEDELDQYTQLAVDDSVFVINSFMEKLNTAMIEQSMQTKLIK